MGNMNFKLGDILLINAHTSAPGKGLSYRRDSVVALVDGRAGGWDVYEGTELTAAFANARLGDDEQTEISFYGFSVRAINGVIAEEDE